MLWIALLLVLGATACDLRAREIPDAFPLAVLVLALVRQALGWSDLSWAAAGAGFFVALVVGLLLFKSGGFGGGDAKLLAALGALLGPTGFLGLFVCIGLAGGVLSLVALMRRQRELAYGPAIALGFLVFLLWTEGPGRGALA